MNFGKQSKSDENISIIARGVEIKGTVNASGSIRIDGIIKGNVTLSGDAVIGETGEVEGIVKAKNITVGGKITGSLHAEDKILLEAKSALHGDINAKNLVIESGAVFDGKSMMGHPNQPPVVTPPPPVTMFTQPKKDESVKQSIPYVPISKGL